MNYVAAVVLFLIAFAIIVILGILTYPRTAITADHRSHAKKCSNCGRWIEWRMGLADKAKARLRDHRKVCES
jgi:hypothetical protein